MRRTIVSAVMLLWAGAPIFVVNAFVTPFTTTFAIECGYGAVTAATNQGEAR